MPACRLLVPVHGIEPWLIPCLTCNPSVPPQWGQVTGNPPVVAAAAVVVVVVAMLPDVRSMQNYLGAKCQV